MWGGVVIAPQVHDLQEVLARWGGGEREREYWGVLVYMLHFGQRFNFPRATVDPLGVFVLWGGCLRRDELVSDRRHLVRRVPIETDRSGVFCKSTGLSSRFPPSAGRRPPAGARLLPPCHAGGGRTSRRGRASGLTTASATGWAPSCPRTGPPVVRGGRSRPPPRDRHRHRHHRGEEDDASAREQPEIPAPHIKWRAPYKMGSRRKAAAAVGGRAVALQLAVGRVAMRRPLPAPPKDKPLSPTKYQ